MLRLAHRGIAPATLVDVRPVVRADELRDAGNPVDAITVSDQVISYVAAVIRRTREVPSVALGASPRAAIHLLAAAKAAACMVDRAYVIPDDVQAVARAVLPPRWGV